MHLCFEARLPLADETWKFLADEWGRFVSFCDPFLPFWHDMQGKLCQAALDQKRQGQRGWTAAPPSRAFHFLSPVPHRVQRHNDTNPGADRIKNAQQIPKLLQSRVRWDPSAGKLLRRQHGLPGALDRNFRSWVFLKRGPNKNPPWTILLPLLGNATVWGLGCPPCFLGHP